MNGVRRSALSIERLSMTRRSPVAAVLTVLAIALGVAAPVSLRAAAGAREPLEQTGPSRVKTWYYYGLNNVNASVPPELMARYAEFAEDDGDEVRHATAFKKAGGRYAVSYTDPAYVPYCFPPFLGPNASCRGQVGKLIHDERAWFHGPDGTRVRRYVDPHFGYQEAINPASAAARAAWRETTEAILRNGPIDLFLADDSGGPLRAGDMSPKSSEFLDFNEAGVEITRDEDFRDQWIAYLSYAAKPIIINGDDPTDGKPSYGGAFLRAPFVWGATHEGCFRHGGGPVSSELHDAWRHEADSLLANTALRKFAVCYVLGPPTPATRMYALASWWLTFDPQWSVIGPITPVPGQSALLPEFSIFPANPLRTAAATVLSLRSAGGAYVREFRACYQDGRSIGGCAAVVNPTAHETVLPPLETSYARRLALTHDDLLHGGRAEWQVGIPRSVAATSAVILAR